MGKPSSNRCQSPIEPLTPREQEVLLLLADERLSNQEIGLRLTITTNSVKWYTHQIYEKLGVKDRRHAVNKARELGLLRSEMPVSNFPTRQLPIPITSFLGRERQVSQICRMLRDQGLRLVTLTGAGGVGKTRLAIQVADQLRPVFPHGVWLVEMDAINHEQFVNYTIALMFDVKEAQNRDIKTGLREYLRDKKLLLVLDNCEHLIGSCASLVEDLLKSCQNVRILVTSREALNIVGEVPYVVPSLSFPSPSNHLPDQDQLCQYEAVRLFTERATAVQPDFELTRENMLAVMRICQKLDGIPLALELAAARLKIMDVFQLADRLDESFQLLAGGSRTALPRHKTMRGSIEWSYNLLTEAEQGLLQRLSIFAGGWTLEAAEAVCSDLDRQWGAQVIELLDGLINKSLIQFQVAEGNRSRYHILETVRQYAQERLSDSGCEEAARDRHLQYFLYLGEQAGVEITGPKQLEWVFWLERELENLRLALEWSLGLNCSASAAERIDAGLRLAVALMWFWHIRSRDSEGAEWLHKLLEAAGVEGEIARTGVEREKIPQLLTWIRARNAACFLSRFTFKSYTVDQIRKMLDETITKCRAADGRAEHELAWAIEQRASLRAVEGSQQAEAEFLEALAIFRRNGLRFEESHCLYLYSAWFWDDLPKSDRLLTESLTLLESMESTETDLGATIQLNLAVYSFAYSDSDQCRKLFTQGLPYYWKVGNIGGWACFAAWQYNRYPEPENLAAADLALAYQLDHEPETQTFNILVRAEAEWSLGHYELAESIARKALILTSKVNDRTCAAFAQVLLARCACGQGDLVWASQNWKTLADVWREDSAVDEWAKKNALDGIAFYLKSTGKMDATARVLGAVDEAYQKLYFSNNPRENREHDASLAAARQALGEESFSRAWKAGQAMTLWQAFQYGLYAADLFEPGSPT